MRFLPFFQVATGKLPTTASRVVFIHGTLEQQDAASVESDDGKARYLDAVVHRGGKDGVEAFGVDECHGFRIRLVYLCRRQHFHDPAWPAPVAAEPDGNA